MDIYGRVLNSLILFAVFVVINSQAFSAPKISILTSPIPLITPVYFSDTKKTISLELTGIKKCLNVSATLLQLTTRLGTELSAHTVIDCKHSKHDFSQASVKLNFHLKTPTVRHESKFKLEFTSCNDQQSCISLGEVAFSVLPSDLLEPIKVWAKKHSLYVYDKSNVLQSFLDQNSIEYIETKNLLPKNEPLISLVVLASEEQEIDKVLPADKTQPVILFREYASEFPTIIDRTQAKPPLIDVQHPLIERLASDGAAQKLFLKLFYMLPQVTPETVTFLYPHI